MPSRKRDFKSAINKKVSKWLTEEKYRYAIVDDEEAYRNLLLEIKDFKINLIIRRDKLDSLILAATIGLTPEDQRAFNYLKPEKRAAFIQECELALLQIGVDYEFQPNQENTENITLFRVLFYDGLTKQSFFDVILKFSCALEMANLLYSKLRASVLFP